MGVEVKMVSIMPAMLTPGMIRNNYETVILYDFNEWLEAHVKTLGENPIPSCNMWFCAHDLKGELNMDLAINALRIQFATVLTVEPAYPELYSVAVDIPSPSES